MTTPFRLFYSDGACSLAPHIALEETGASFEPIRIDMASDEQRKADFLRINPKGRVPALAVEDWVLTENPAILQFIAQSFPDAGLWPQHHLDQARLTEWLAWIASTVHVAYAHVRRAERYVDSDTALAEVRAKGLQTCRDLWQAVDARLGEGPWAIGEHYTVADAYLLVFWTWGRGAVQRVFARERLTLPADA